jgi:hypothetical protein
MNKYSSYIILKDLNLVIEYYRGQIIIDDIIHLKKNVFSEKNHHYEIKIVMDFRDANTEIDSSDLVKYLEFIEDYTISQGFRKVAFITSQPNQVALGILFGFIKNKPMKTEVFSTFEAALCCLNVNTNSFVIIENIIMNISKNVYYLENVK